MSLGNLQHSRVSAVIAGASVLVMLGGVGGAFAAHGNGHESGNGHNNGGDHGHNNGGDHGHNNGGGHGDSHGGDHGTHGYTGVHWGIVDRNVIGGGDAYLRTGPYAANFDRSVEPPYGEGSLGIRTADGGSQAAFGNQVDFVGDAFGDLDTVAYSVYTTGENRDTSPTNLPNIGLELDPNTTDSGGGAINYTDAVFNPEAVPANQWSRIDASTAKRWYLTGAAGGATGCEQGSYCTLGELQSRIPDATIYTVQIQKGRDYAFSGAVDGLVLNDTVYDFEPYGVRTRHAH